jgi:hypothetical protein
METQGLLQALKKGSKKGAQSYEVKFVSVTWSQQLHACGLKFGTNDRWATEWYLYIIAVAIDVKEFEVLQT